MKTRKLCLLLALALCAPAAQAAFRCVDEKGRTHIGDTPPAGCKNVVMYEVTRGGTVLRKIDPSLTEEQVRARAEAEERQRLADKAAAEQKRKDSALLSTYANEKEFDTTRDRNIEPLKQRIVQSEQRNKEIDKRVKQVKEEMEFYTAGKKKGDKGKDQAAPMAAELERLDDEKKQVAKNIVDYNREIAEIRSKFDADKQRWVALKRSGGKLDPKLDAAATEAKAEPVKVDAKSAKK
jgi:chromosome segregation ATPase